MAARLKERYVKEVVPALGEGARDRQPAWRFPRLEKIVLNMGLGEAVANPKILDGRRGGALRDRRSAAPS